jgi:triosephosphate isomerase
MRRAMIAANAKMNLDRATLLDLLTTLRGDLAKTPAAAEVVYCPPFPLLAAARDVLNSSAVAWGGQNLHWEEKGAYTGEVSAAMLLDFGCRYVITGHSERRALFGESDDQVALKSAAAVSAGLVPILCIGETEAERDAGATEIVLTRQIVGSLAGVQPETPGHLVIAYEPVWAIGTGRTATPQQAQSAHAHVRSELRRALGSDFADGVRILYGGSVNPGNAASLLRLPDVDGALVGGASLKAETFLPIVRVAEV